jgi:hypothetical protein
MPKETIHVIASGKFCMILGGQNDAWTNICPSLQQALQQAGQRSLELYFRHERVIEIILT